MSQAFARTNLTITVVEAMITAFAATIAVLAGLPIWAMFVGWIAYFTRGLDPRNGVINLSCVLMGLLLGISAATVLSAFGPPATLVQQAAVVFGLGLVVLSLRFVPVINNLLGYFLGIVAWFAAQQPPGIDGFVLLGFAATLGTAAGAIAHGLQKYLVRRSAAIA